MSLPRGVRGIGWVSVSAPLESLPTLEFHALSSLLLVARSTGYRSYTPANERTSGPTPSCHRSKQPPWELWPYQSYSAGTIMISICWVIFRLDLTKPSSLNLSVALPPVELLVPSRE